MRLTIRTNLAMRTLMYCAVNPDRHVRKCDVAEACHASANHLAQVISQLARAGLISTARGRNGGISLARPADQIRVGEVFRTFEAGVPFAECFSGKANTCPLTAFCKLRGVLGEALNEFYAKLDRICLSDLIEGNEGLINLLSESDATLRSPCVSAAE